MKMGILAIVLAVAWPAVAQAPLPNAPAPVVATPAQATGAIPAAPAGLLTHLTREEAERMALRNNPRIHVVQLIVTPQEEAATIQEIFAHASQLSWIVAPEKSA